MQSVKMQSVIQLRMISKESLRGGELSVNITLILESTVQFSDSAVQA